MLNLRVVTSILMGVQLAFPLKDTNCSWGALGDFPCCSTWMPTSCFHKLILPCDSIPTQSSFFQHEQPCCRQQSCQHKETWESNPPDIYRKDFHGELFPREVVSLQTATPGSREPGPLRPHSHLHYLPHFGQKRRFAMCAVSPPSPVTISLHTPPQDTVVMLERSTTLVLHILDEFHVLQTLLKQATWGLSHPHPFTTSRSS